MLICNDATHVPNPLQSPLANCHSIKTQVSGFGDSVDEEKIRRFRGVPQSRNAKQLNSVWAVWVMVLNEMRYTWPL